MPFLARRECIPELMDDPALDPAEHRRALAGLARLNRVSDSPGVLWPAVRELARGGPVRVLDVATGSGDVPRALAAKAARAGLTDVTFAGCDISPTAIDAASRPGAGRAGRRGRRTSAPAPPGRPRRSPSG
jgi:SAM-dependent methyltransferase